MAEVEVVNGVEKNCAAKSVVFTAMKPQLQVEAPKGKEAVEFYKSAFGAEEVGRVLHPKRKAEQDVPLILSADLKISSSLFSVSDIHDSALVKTEGGGGIAFCLETDDVESAISKAVSAGAVAEGELTEDELGGRVGKVKDPYGFLWIISSPSKKSADVEA